MKSSTLSIAAVLASLFGVVAGALGDTATVPPCGQFDCSAKGPVSTAPPALGTIPVPEPANLGRFVKDKAAAILLGKALFWEMQIGSDGVTACASCHFHAGADSRSINQMHPGSDAKRDFRPNLHLTAKDFPLRKLSDETDRGSRAERDVDHIVSSQGVFNMDFKSINDELGTEKVKRPFDPVFQVQGLNVRRVEPRHTPSVINAVFNHRNFWDGRAQNEFNGVNNWGDRDPDARVVRAETNDSMPEAIRLAGDLRLTNASLASQAVAPILSSTEMSADGRDAADIASKLGKLRGKKVGQLRPLALQMVHPEDSVLGPYSRAPLPGLTINDYPTIIRAAFREEWWDSNYIVKVEPDGSVRFKKKNNQEKLGNDEFTLMEYNFGLFFGLAIQLYEATLVSNDTPYDRWREGKASFPQQAFDGLKLFLSVDRPFVGTNGVQQPGTGQGARCINCHAGPAFTDASVFTITTLDPAKPDEGSVRRKREGQELDRGFNNIGVRSTKEDRGVGGQDKFGKSLSATQLCRDRSGVGTPESPCPPTASTFIAVDGAFKVPGLRNVELTAPYFHNGGHLTLESVMEFYSRGGDFGCDKTRSVVLATLPVSARCSDLPGAQPATPILDFYGKTEIRPLGIPGVSAPQQGLTLPEQANLVAFMKSLTDERVRYRQAPFDHPQLFIPHGQLNDDLTAVRDPDRKEQASDRVREIRAVGKNGVLREELLPGFLGYR